MGDGSTIIAEYRRTSTSNNLIYYIYDMMGLSGFVYNGANYYYEKNTLGDIIGIRNSSGTQVATYTYDAWGNIITKTGSMADINPFRYRGYYYDTETGFYYLQTRYYDPTIRMFINADNYELLPTLSQTVGQLNLYAYANNNPIMFTDETGESVLIALILATFTIIGAGVGYFTGVEQGYEGLQLIGHIALAAGIGLMAGGLAVGLSGAVGTVLGYAHVLGVKSTVAFALGIVIYDLVGIIISSVKSIRFNPIETAPSNTNLPSIEPSVIARQYN